MENLAIHVDSVTPSSHVLKFGILRISVLSSRLIRVEKWIYRDQPTQRVWYRNFGTPEFSVEKKGKKLLIHTLDCTFEISLTGRVKATLKDKTKLSRKGNLLGTARTLDNVNGSTRLCKGLISKGGLTILDDSDGLIIDGEKILPRSFANDKYYFAYGSDYRGTMKAFYALTGEIPLIPKYVLGNWWSRYKAYTQDEYIGLMQKFMDKKIPLTVATIDMDWHWVRIDKKFGKDAMKSHSLSIPDKFFAVMMPGWTGYTWNTDLFPDHKKMLDWLNANGLKVPLNVHPSQGIRYFEDNYDKACEIVGQDPAKKEPVIFDLSNPKFLEAYFTAIHHPLEDEGIALWWIDWQQGKKSQIKGLDPLWALNHYHYLDSARNGKRPLILSRFAEIGSHRYPLGFSGDTVISWKSLDFQPYFTANASNVGYTWWSHDIGGHKDGRKNDELYLRWLQLGVFSPINRLHSTINEFSGKEPWNCSAYTERVATEFLRLRHKLIPYLYTANYNSHTKGIAICEPLYYTYKDAEAYKHKNEYIFGGKLLCAPITQKTDSVTGLASVDVWLPENQRYTDVFTGVSYQGGKVIKMFRNVESFPCLAKEGTIIPMYKNCLTNSLALDQDLEIDVYRGTGSYSLYEDDGETNEYQNGKYSISKFSVNATATSCVFAVKQNVEGELKIDDRAITVVFKDIVKANITVNGVKVDSESQDKVTVTVKGDAVIELADCEYPKGVEHKQAKVQTIARYQMGNLSKTLKFTLFIKGKTAKSFASKRYTDSLKEIDQML